MDEKDILEIFQKEGNIGEIRKELGERWNIKWQNTEKIRFSNEQEIFFDQLRIMTKYHMWQKAGGGIVNNLRDENDTIISDTNEMNKKIKKFFEDIHLAPEKYTLTKSERWKGLSPLEEEETIQLMKGLAKGKAISFDLIGDELFEVKEYKNSNQKINLEKRINILRNVWNEDILNHQNFNIFLDSRLIPLNKKFPNVPKVDEIRPIIVRSQLIKFMEMRFAKKLKTYLNEKLSRSQTGFVPGMGVEVNINRINEPAKKRKKK